MSTENDSLIGKQLGAYQVQASLGEGGMARVYKAYHPRLRREVAIKVILAQIADREGFQARFEREAQVIASLDHPNIVSIYDFASEGHLTYLVMQYVGGGTLRDQLRGKRPLEPLRAITYAIQMARALHSAHQRGIVHRDVKPQNMLISSTNPNHLLLSDFGIAKLYQGGEDSAIAEMPTRVDEEGASLTRVGQIIGTADYMAPEQARGKPVDARTDVYALGVVLYQMLTGEVPFRSNSLQGLLFHHVYTTPPSVREKNPLIPEILAQIVAKAMAKAPEERFQTAEEMARALEFANSNATNPLASLAQSNLADLSTLAYPQPGPTMLSATATQRSRLDSYTTRTDASTGPATLRVTQTSGTALPNTGTGITGLPLPVTKKRPFPLSYIILAVVLIAGLVVVSTRVLPNLTGGSSPGASHNGSVQAFDDNFQNNNQGWQTGPLNNGVTATNPGGGQYSVTVPPAQTAFPYPQNVAALPANFTLSATIQENSGPASVFYGIAFHFSQDSSGTNGYALVINNSGSWELTKYKSATTIPPPSASGRYTTPGQGSHTIKVQAQGSNYTFFVDGKPLTIATSSNSSNTNWSDGDVQGGSPALQLSGPNSGSTAATFVITNVQLSIP
jgi:serine/threonine protein kinase